MTSSMFEDYTAHYVRIHKQADELNEYYNQIAEFVDRHGFFATGQFGDSLEENIAIRARRNVPSPLAGGGTYVDLGCGVGNFLKHLADLNPQSNFIGVNISDAQLKYAEERGNTGENISYIHASLDNVPDIADESVDGVVMVESMGYRPMGQTLAEIRRILKSGGWVTSQDIVQCDDINMHQTTELRTMQKAWGYAFAPVWYQAEAIRRAGFSLAYLNPNIDILLDYQPWSDLCTANDNELLRIHGCTAWPAIKSIEMGFSKP